VELDIHIGGGSFKIIASSDGCLPRRQVLNAFCCIGHYNRLTANQYNGVISYICRGVDGSVYGLDICLVNPDFVAKWIDEDVRPGRVPHLGRVEDPTAWRD
jgi:hypothetical protein